MISPLTNKLGFEKKAFFTPANTLEHKDLRFLTSKSSML
ncbi:hypothetical protein VCHE48_0361 [Vibrio cholerae HE48]|nr:hypothetical protein VCHE48_0361 [Vibrio cholerae HE48]